MSSLARIEPLLERLRAVHPAWLAVGAALTVVALAAFAYAPLFGEGMILTGDNLHAWRLSEMGNCIDDGQIPCRWAAELGNGYGLPLFNFYPPLPYYAGDILHRLGLSYLNTVDALFVIGLIVAALSMFLLGRSLWGTLGGVVSATAYVYAPYLALDSYMRGALGELWALAIAPAIFWAVYRLVTTGRSLYVLPVAFFSAFLLLSHSLATLILLPMIAIWAFALLATRGPDFWRPALLGSIAALWGLGLAAFFTLPMLAEGGNIQLENTITFSFGAETPLYQSNFTSVSDLFLLRSSDYSALLAGSGGPGTPIQIGWFHWALAGLALPAGALLLLSGRRVQALAILLLAGFFAAGVFMSISASEGIWETYDALRFLQFPWRYVGLISLTSAALAGAWFAVIRNLPAWLQFGLAAGLVALFIVGGQGSFEPFHRCTVDPSRLVPCAGSDAEYFSDGPYAQSERGSIRDYLPEAVEVVPERASQTVTITAGAANVRMLQRDSDSLALAIDASSPVRIEAAVFDYPGWEVRVDGEAVPHSASEPHGLITFNVPQGEHDIELTLGSTNTARVANWISLASWAAFAIALPASFLWSVRKRRDAGA